MPSDKFIHSITKDYFFGQANNNSILKDAALDIQLDKIKDIAKNENLNSEELKTFLEKNKKFFKKELEKFNNGQADEVTTKFKNIIEKYNKNSNYIKEQLTQVLDTSKKKFNYNNLGTKLKELVEVGEFGLRSSNAMKIGGIAAIGLGALALIATKIKANQDKQ